MDLRDPDQPAHAEGVSVDDTAGRQIRRVKVAVLGAGVAGICAGVQLKQHTDFDFVILEKEDEIGGTWRDNTYPGVECDVPSHLYSYSFELKPDWTREYPSGGEIFGYLRDVVDKYGLRPHVMTGAHVLEAAYEGGSWLLTMASGEQLRADAIISALGILHVPKMPSWPGLESFKGPAFHSARWRHDLDLTGKRVGIVGTGATTVQLGPKTAEIAERLFVFQRSPVWVAPKNNMPIAEDEREHLRLDHTALRRKRWDLWKSWESTALEMVTPGSRLNTRAQEAALRHLQTQVHDPALAARLTPDFNYSCKRPTFSDDYFPMFNRDNVELVTDGIDHVTETGIVTHDGTAIDLDVLVFATGFKSCDITAELDFRGEDGVALRDVWAERITSYRTVMAPKMPNLFILFGPNSAGLTSAYQMIEAGCVFAIKALKYLNDNGLAAMTPKMGEVVAFCEDVQKKFKRTTLNRGCTSWYTDGSGYTHANWPSSSLEYRMLMNQLAPEHFDFSQAG
ncbi:MAG: 4-hydroxyacetophenone monooxygenase [Caulobacter sp.]|nr:4-hydroxyacetophenone monooxygenase [Caulobacter sp.]